MIMGASAGAYSAALFHLMTHAFFKALLFMAAGSIIGAMAGDQSLDRMSGFRKALPFTFICFIVGGLALSGIPPFSGWLSKDDIIAYLNNRGGIYEVLGRHPRLPRCVADRAVHLPDDLPRLLRRALAGSQGA
jgi:NADH-quinone oxidoreductase subunit L